MKSTGLRRADYVKPRLAEARVARMWSAIEMAQTRPKHRRALYYSLAAAFAAACIVLALWGRFLSVRHEHAALRAVTSGDTLATESQQREVTLPDGSVLSLAPSTRLDVVRVAEDAVRLRLVRGVITCDVPRVANRQFVVQAGQADVTVKGTRFTVELEPGATVKPELSVSVERGRVQLRADGQTVTAMLDAGQKWSSQKAVPVPTLEPPETRFEPDASVSTSQKPTLVPPALPDAKELMERANASRLAGRAVDAAREYAHLLKAYPTDVRAGLAAFELGRIRLNTLGDARGAVTAFRFALAHAGAGAGYFAEDAAAGIVEGWSRLGDARACAAARDDFLTRYPTGAHAAHLRGLCEIK